MPRFRAIHTALLKPEADPAEFERFMLDEFFAAKKRLPGCLDAQLLKGYRGWLPGVAQSKSDYAWITLWESPEANNAVWSEGEEHATPQEVRPLTAKLYVYCATVSLVGGFTVVPPGE